MRFAAPLLALLLSVAAILFVTRHRPRGDARIAAPDATTLARAQRRWNDATLAQLSEGHRLMGTACRECHGIPDPHSRRAEEWPGLVAEMGGRAELDGRQREALLRYVLSIR